MVKKEVGKDIPMVFVGNKLDLSEEDRQVKSKHIEAFKGNRVMYDGAIKVKPDTGKKDHMQRTLSSRESMLPAQRE